MMTDVDKPYGGLAMLWKISLDITVKYLYNSLNKRVITVMMKCKDENICVCNVYLSCYENNIEYTKELLECLAHIDLLFTEQRNINKNLELCIIGDFKIDCTRIVKNTQVAVIDRSKVNYDMKKIT